MCMKTNFDSITSRLSFPAKIFGILAPSLGSLGTNELTMMFMMAQSDSLSEQTK